MKDRIGKFRDLDYRLTKDEERSQAIISMIRNLPDDEPPEGFVERVMDALPSPKILPWWMRFYRLTLTPQSVRFTPLKLAAATTCCAIAIFVVAVWIDTNNAPRYSMNSLNMQDPEANFYMGRSLLASNQPEKALPYLEKAVMLSPDMADFHFWLGVANWALMNFNEEREHYMQAVSLDQNHISANLYLGHSFMDSGEWEKALLQYNKVLAIDPTLPDALYNRGLVFKKLGRTADEILAWKKYLKVNQWGKWALRAVNHLNVRGDFSYGIHLIDTVRMVIKKPTFNSVDDLMPDSLSSLDRLGQMLENNRKLYVHVVVYFKDNHERAFLRAKNIRKYLTDKYPDITPGRIRISWFDSTEEIEVNDTTYHLDESVRFIGQIENKEGGEMI